MNDTMSATKSKMFSQWTTGVKSKVAAELSRKPKKDVDNGKSKLLICTELAGTESLPIPKLETIVLDEQPENAREDSGYETDGPEIKSELDIETPPAVQEHLHGQREITPTISNHKLPEDYPDFDLKKPPSFLEQWQYPNPRV
jgi:hypothetical protein